MTLKFIKNMPPHEKPELQGNPEISWQKRVYHEKVFQSFSEFSVLVGGSQYNYPATRRSDANKGAKNVGFIHVRSGMLFPIAVCMQF